MVKRCLVLEFKSHVSTLAFIIYRDAAGEADSEGVHVHLTSNSDVFSEGRMTVNGEKTRPQFR